MSYDLGDTIPLTWAPGKAGTVAVTVTLPDGSTSTPVVSGTGTGPFTASLTATQAGQGIVRWVMTGANVDAYPDVFTVLPAADTGIISTADAKEYLGKTVSASDDELRRFILTASAGCEKITGRIWRQQTVSETHDGGVQVLVLRKTPVQSITSATEYGVTVASTEYLLDAANGLLARGMRGLQPWVPGWQNIVITYVVGPTVVPDPIRQGVAELARHLWSTQRGGSNLPRNSTADDYDPRLGYAVPRRVAELWDPYSAPAL